MCQSVPSPGNTELVQVFVLFKDYLSTQLDVKGKQVETKQKIDKETVELKFREIKNSLSWTLNWTTYLTKFKQPTSRQRQKKSDIYCLQEAHIQNSKIDQARWKPQRGYEAFFSSLDSKRVIILFNNTFEYVLHNVISDQQGRYIILDISIFQQRCTLVTLFRRRPSNDILLPEKNLAWVFNEPFDILGITFFVETQQIVEYNYRMKLDEVRKLLDSWS